MKSPTSRAFHLFLCFNIFHTLSECWIIFYHLEFNIRKLFLVLSSQVHVTCSLVNQLYEFVFIICHNVPILHKINNFARALLRLCAGLDLNQRSPEATDLQSVVIDHSTTDAYIYSSPKGRIYHIIFLCFCKILS